VSRILVVSPYRTEYGPREVLDHVLRALVMAGIEPVALMPPGARSPDAIAELDLPIEYVERLGTVPRTVSPVRLGKFASDHLAAARSITEIGRQLDASAIYSISEATLCGSLSARSLGVPGFVHAIGMSIQSPRITASVYISVLDRITDHLIACSSAVAEMFARFNVSDSKISVVHNGISVARVDEHAAVPFLFSEHRPRIGMVAAYDPRKGHDLFVAAAARIAAAEPDAVFYLIGGTLAGHAESRRYEQHIADLIDRLGLASRFVHTGYVTAPDVYEWMRAMDVVVVPSRTEAFAHALLEAVACARPIVATGIEGNLDAFVHEHSGLYADSTPDAVAGHVVRYLRDPSFAAEVGRQARNRVSLLFDLSATLPANAAVVLDALEATGAASESPRERSRRAR
jgi:glycosyltransferase involved in cell wall biosynthesis